MLWCPETPAWLASHGRTEQARRLLLQVTNQEEADRFLQGLADRRMTSGLRELLKPAARPALVLGITLAVVQQFSGINAVISYAPSIMERTGLNASASILYSVIIGAINLAATVVAVQFVDRTGRRRCCSGRSPQWR
jgi:MFS family permease